MARQPVHFGHEGWQSIERQRWLPQGVTLVTEGMARKRLYAQGLMGMLGDIARRWIAWASGLASMDCRDDMSGMRSCRRSRCPSEHTDNRHKDDQNRM